MLPRMHQDLKFRLLRGLQAPLRQWHKGLHVQVSAAVCATLDMPATQHRFDVDELFVCVGAGRRPGGNEEGAGYVATVDTCNAESGGWEFGSAGTRTSWRFWCICVSQLTDVGDVLQRF
jgi:hypothetical protein